MKIKTVMNLVFKKAAEAFHTARGQLRRAVSYAARRFHWETIGYYALLTAVLAGLGAGAYAYRNREVQTQTISADPTPAPALSIPAQADPTAAPEETFIAPVQGEILAGYAADDLVWSDTLGLWQTHPAVDLGASAGEAVLAAADGTVLEAFADALYGNVIVIDHGEGRTLRYASLNTLQLVEIGQKVSKGEVISAAGTCSAEAELGAHVHLEYFVHQEPADFSELLK